MDPNFINKWNKFIYANPNCSPFCTPDFFELYNSTPNNNAELVYVEENDVIKALAVITMQKEKGVKSFFSRRAINYGGILFEEEKYIPELLLRIQKTLQGKVIYTEIRNYFNYENVNNFFIENSWDYIDYTDVIIPLNNFESTEEYLDSLKYNRKREIKQSLQNGAIYREAESIEEIKELYDILYSLYNEKVKLPLPTLDYFVELFKSKIGKTFVVIHENKVIGGAFTLFLASKNIFTLYYCGLQDYHKKIFPTHLAILATVDFSLSHKIPYVDLMGSGRKNVEYGVRKFKLNFGGELVEYGRYRYINNKMLFKLGEAALKIMQR